MRTPHEPTRPNREGPRVAVHDGRSTVSDRAERRLGDGAHGMRGPPEFMIPLHAACRNPPTGEGRGVGLSRFMGREPVHVGPAAFHALLIGAVVVSALSTALEHAAGSEVSPRWRLVWADEFDGANGSAPNPAKWTFDLGGKGWGNQELQTYTARRENARLENGHLLLEARRESFAGSDGRRRDYTSARLKTQGKAAWTYGRVEARIQLPSGQGMWPAFWMLGADVQQVGWPACGEIDMMENIGREPATVHGTVHGPGYSGAKGIGRPFTLPAGRRFADAFHVFALEWEPRRLQWSVDGRVYFTLTPEDLPKGTKWVFDKPQFLLLNLAVGGAWPGAPDASTTFPQTMLVDYVRVYARTEIPTPSPR